MPPPSIPTGLSRVSNLTSSNNGSAHLPKIFLLALAVATCIRLVLSFYSRKKSRVPTSCQQLQEKVPSSCQAPAEKVVRQDRYPESQDHQQLYPRSGSREQISPEFKSIYPWTCPPQPLPGPYDPRLYPLPTIRRHSYPEPSQGTPAETHTISYTRRVSTTNVPSRHSAYHGTLTTSSKGWRRNQWVVSGG